MPRRPKKKSKGNIHGSRKSKKKQFWDQEYSEHAHLRISDAPSSDMLKYFRYCERTDEFYLPTEYDSVVDIGCGNGRNILYVAENYGARGVGYDYSEEAIEQCQEKAQAKNLLVEFMVRDVSESIPVEDSSQKLVLDLMVTHVLKKEQRQFLLKEVHRVLEDDGFYLFKTFLRDDDLGAQELIKKHPGTEEGSYIHPKMGIEEHVFWEDEVMSDLEQYFQIQRVYKSHRHRDREGRAAKRRSIILYAQKRA